MNKIIILYSGTDRNETSDYYNTLYPSSKKKSSYTISHPLFKQKINSIKNDLTQNLLDDWVLSFLSFIVNNRQLKESSMVRVGYLGTWTVIAFKY